MFRYFDTAMCALWILTYTIVLIGTVRYRYPLISPIAQAIIAPFEFAVVVDLIYTGDFGADYISVAYTYWTLVEAGIIVATLCICRFSWKKTLLYLLLVTAMSVLMCRLVVGTEHRFFFSYFNTFYGMVFWLFRILKKDYPMKALSLAAFVTKFVADLISIPVYFGYGFWATDVLCVALPLVDLSFCVIWFVKRQRDRRMQKAQPPVDT